MAQTPDDRRVLLPISTGIVEGAFGSRWYSYGWVFNHTQNEIEIRLRVERPLGDPTTVWLPPEGGDFLSFPARASNSPGAIARIVTGDAEGVSFQIFTKDSSVNPLRRGTLIPSVREEDFLAAKAQFFALRLQQGTRTALRAYALDASPGSRFRLKLYDLITGDLVQESELALFSTDDVDLTYGQMLDLRDVFDLAPPELQGRLEIEPVDPTLRYWAFVSITDNAEHQMTTLLPQTEGLTP